MESPDGVVGAAGAPWYMPHVHAVWPGALSGLVSKVVTHPIDTVKANLQVAGALKRSTAPSSSAPSSSVVTSAWRMNFGASLRGISAVVLGTAPCSAAYYMSYEHGKQMFGSHAFGGMLTGVYAQVLAGVVFTPVDVLKERMQVSFATSGKHTTLWNVARTALAEGGLMRGYWMNNLTWIPWNAIHIALYEEGKRKYRSRVAVNPDDDVPVTACATLALVSGSTAAFVTTPLDVVKTRLQTLTVSDAPSVTAIAQRLLAREGAQALFAGSIARVLSIGPGTALSWMLYESFAGIARDATAAK